MPFSYLKFEEVEDLVKISVNSGLSSPANRMLLLNGILPIYVANLNLLPSPALQLRSDFNSMNSTERLADGSVPLVTWLRNAAALSAGLPDAEVFRKYHDRLARSVSGERDIPDPDKLPEVIQKQVIIHMDDMVDFSFLAAGDKAGESVAKVLVPRFEDGQ